MNLTRLIVEKDSTLVTNMLRNTGKDHGTLNNSVYDYRFLLAKLDFKVRHVHREGNKCADMLANGAIEGTSLILLSFLS